MKHLRNFKNIYDTIGVEVDVPCVISMDGVRDVLIISEFDNLAFNGKVKIVPTLINAYRGDNGDSDVILDSTKYFIKPGNSFGIKYVIGSPRTCNSMDDYIEYMKDIIKNNYDYGYYSKRYYYGNLENDYEFSESDALDAKKRELASNAVSISQSGSSDQTITLYQKKDGTLVEDIDVAAQSYIFIKYMYCDRPSSYSYDYYTDEELTERLHNDIYLWLYDFVD